MIWSVVKMSERCASVPSAVSGMERPLVRCSRYVFSARLGWVVEVMVGDDCGGVAMDKPDVRHPDGCYLRKSFDGGDSKASSGVALGRS